MFGGLINTGTFMFTKKVVGKKVYVSWLLFSFLLSSIYMNEIQSVLVARVRYHPSLEEMAESGIKAYVVADPYYIKDIKPLWSKCN